MSSSQEDDILLEDLGRKVSFKSSAFFLINATIVSAIPVWLFSKILLLDLHESMILYGVISFITIYLIFFSYKNCKFFFKHKLAQARENAIRLEVNANGKLSRKEKDDLILFKKNVVADYEATNYSIFYNNLFFLILITILSVLILRRLNPSVNYVLSSLISSGLVALFSTGQKRG